MEIAWVTECVEEVWADVLHYYHQDIYEMEGAKAMRLANCVLDVVDTRALPDRVEYRSSVFRVWAEIQENPEHQQVASLAHLQSIDPAGDVEFVEVAA